MSVHSPVFAFFISRYSLIALSRSSSSIAFWAIESAPCRRVTVLSPLAAASDAFGRCFTPRGSFFSSGGAWTTSLSRRGAAVDKRSKSSGFSLLAVEGLGVMADLGGVEDESSGFCSAALCFPLDALDVPSSSFLTLRANAEEAFMATRTSPRIESSTRLGRRGTMRDVGSFFA